MSGFRLGVRRTLGFGSVSDSDPDVPLEFNHPNVESTFLVVLSLDFPVDFRVRDLVSSSDIVTLDV